eukprot:366366-Chlamydomonas_euryale.AAC.27
MCLATTACFAQCSEQGLEISTAPTVMPWTGSPTPPTPHTPCLGWPALRSTVLDIVLHAAISVSDDTRGKAVRLTVNQLLVNPVARTVAIEFARKALDRLALPSPLHELVDSAAANGGATPASGAAHHTEGSDAPAESDSAGNASAGAAPRAGVSVTAEAPAAAADGGSVDWSQAEASRFCDLYAALCTRSPDLITGLAAALPKASSSAARAAITASACTLARALGPASSLLASLVRQHPCGSEPLVHAMVEAALEGALPSEELVEVRVLCSTVLPIPPTMLTSCTWSICAFLLGP